MRGGFCYREVFFAIGYNTPTDPVRGRGRLSSTMALMKINITRNKWAGRIDLLSASYL